MYGAHSHEGGGYSSGCKTFKNTVCLLSFRTDCADNVEKIPQLLLQNCYLLLRMLADEVNTGKDTVRKIVVENMRKRKICSCFVLHSLTPEQKDWRNAAC